MGEPFAIAHTISRRILPSGAAEGSGGVGSRGLILLWTLSQTQNPLRTISPGRGLQGHLDGAFSGSGCARCRCSFLARAGQRREVGGKISGGVGMKGRLKSWVGCTGAWRLQETSGCFSSRRELRPGKL